MLRTASPALAAGLLLTVLAACSPSPAGTPATSTKSAAPSSTPASTGTTVSASAAPSPAMSATPDASASPAAAGATTGFYALLSGNNEVPAITTSGSGAAAATLSADGKTLTLRVAVSGLTGAITMAHLHDALAGSNGDVVKPLTFTGNTATLTWSASDADKPLTPALVADLQAGKLYVNVHTQGNPGGELRGQLTTTGSAASAALEPGQEVPPVTGTSASGVALAWLAKDRTSLYVQVATAGLTGPITMAHIHDAEAGSNGDVVKPLTFAGSNTILAWTASDADKPLTPALVADFLAGKLYINIHTAAHPGGEVRGQLLVP